MATCPGPHTFLATILLATVLCTGCGNDRADGGSPTLDAVQPPGLTGAGDPTERDRDDWFTEHAQDLGLTFAHFNGMSGEFYFPEMIPAGVWRARL